MSTRSVLHCDHASGLGGLLARGRTEAPFVAVDPKAERRAKIWDIAPTFHCSIVGTCLTAAELRQFFIRLREPDARTASDHVLHGLAVGAAANHDLAGKMLNKALDKRHETTIKRFARAGDAAAVRGLWLQALEQGEIPGAYWAVMTHPATGRPLIQEVFGEVHMLSHMVGAANRIDIARLRRLERDLGERDAKIERQEARLQAAARDRDALVKRTADLEAALVRLEGNAQARGEAAPDAATAAALAQKLAEEKAHAQAQSEKLSALEERLRKTDSVLAAMTERSARLERELAILEDCLGPDGAEAPGPAAIPRALNGLRLLYVGGRPKLLDQLKAATAQRDGVLLAHDGGVEDNAALLPGLISQADRIFFPVDCISHDAVGQVKKLCRRLGKPYVPLRSASLASFIAALAAGAGPVAGESAGAG